MKAGQRQAPHHRGEGRNPRVQVSCPRPALETFEYLAYKRGQTVSAWLLDAGRAAAIEQGGDPDIGAP